MDDESSSSSDRIRELEARLVAHGIVLKTIARLLSETALAELKAAAQSIDDAGMQESNPDLHMRRVAEDCGASSRWSAEAGRGAVARSSRGLDPCADATGVSGSRTARRRRPGEGAAAVARARVDLRRQPADVEPGLRIAGLGRGPRHLEADQEIDVRAEASCAGERRRR